MFGKKYNMFRLIPYNTIYLILFDTITIKIYNPINTTGYFVYS